MSSRFMGSSILLVVTYQEAILDQGIETAYAIPES